MCHLYNVEVCLFIYLSILRNTADGGPNLAKSEINNVLIHTPELPLYKVVYHTSKKSQFDGKVREIAVSKIILILFQIFLLFFFEWNTKDVSSGFVLIVVLHRTFHMHTHSYCMFVLTKQIMSIIVITVQVCCSFRVKPSSDCGPFSNLASMLLLGKKWIKGLGKSKPSMLWLSWAYNNLVDNPLFLFITAGLFL